MFNLLLLTPDTASPALPCSPHIERYCNYQRVHDATAALQSLTAKHYDLMIAEGVGIASLTLSLMAKLHFLGKTLPCLLCAPEIFEAERNHLLSLGIETIPAASWQDARCTEHILRFFGLPIIETKPAESTKPIYVFPA
jgi:hypothetical protein